eukprot:TRINITY_DN4483_c0_g1_i1.p1 TRINITY_DN4483_c0_g1~~TRINITY_DN4483_c0_g1_i1.p1  ORF type:complete len:182 (-),score=16.98 TRINITY_DN4483_c0_g1_i1:169-714(-)
MNQAILKNLRSKAKESQVAESEVGQAEYCNCIPCGESEPHEYGSGSCAPENPGECDAAHIPIGGGGCYSSVSGKGCDCSTGHVLSSQCSCIRCGEKTHEPDFDGGVCGVPTDECSKDKSGDGCYSSFESADCDCRTRTPIEPRFCSCIPCGTIEPFPYDHHGAICGPAIDTCNAMKRRKKS